MLKFRNPLDSSSRIGFNTAVGCSTRPIFKSVLGKNGEIELQEDGVEDLDAYIQSFKDSVDINVIVSRYASGDTYALEQRVGAYGDFVSVPASYMDVLNSIVELRSSYDSLDGTFEGSFEDYVKSILNPVKDTVEASSDIEKNGGDVNE